MEMKSIVAPFAHAAKPDIQQNLDFNRCAPMDTVSACMLAVEGIGNVDTAEIATLSNNKRFRLYYSSGDLSDYYDIDFNDHTISNGNMECLRRDRATGRRMYANRMMLGLVLGMEEVHNTSGNLMGGYTWARAGMYLKKGKEHDVRRDLVRRLDVLDGFIPYDLWDYLRDLADLRNKTDLRLIAEESFLIEDARRMFDKIGDEAESYIMSTFSEYQKQGFYPEGSMTLGQMLLVGNTYHVYANLRDNEQMDNIEQYCGVQCRARAAEIYASLAYQPTRGEGLNPPTQSAERLSIPASQTAHPQ